eukprot:14509005-Alexandrium_andersonii.AAC.1
MRSGTSAGMPPSSEPSPGGCGGSGWARGRWAAGKGSRSRAGGRAAIGDGGGGGAVESAGKGEDGEG